MGGGGGGDFAKSARRDVIDPFHALLSFGSRPPEKSVSALGELRKKLVTKSFGGEAGTFGGGGGGGGGEAPPPHWIEPCQVLDCIHP